MSDWHDVENNLAFPPQEDRGFSFNNYSLIELNEFFNVISVCFRPFDDFEKWDNEKDRREELESMKYSTIYKGIRYYFDNPADLKNFCEMVER